MDQSVLVFLKSKLGLVIITLQGKNPLCYMCMLRLSFFLFNLKNSHERMQQ